jgi:hypothetical protein
VSYSHFPFCLELCRGGGPGRANRKGLYSFGSAAKEHPKLLYNSTAYFLAMAIADNALFGIDSLDDGNEWIRPASEPLFNRTRTWASCHVDGFRCSLVAHRDVAGGSGLALFISSRLSGPLSPRPQARPGRLSCGWVQTQPDTVSFLGIKSDDL